MGRYVLKRLLWLVIILWAAGIVAFTLMYFVPGDPAQTLLGTDATEAALVAKRAALGVDRPYGVQLLDFMSNAFLRFDFGESWVYGKPVMDELLIRLPRTLIIGLSAMILNVVVGTLLGIFAATHKGKWNDSLTMVIAMVFISLPDFWVALMCILLFSSKLGWLPARGIDSWTCYIMPIICSALPGIAINARQGRSAMLEVINADFIATARAKGQKEKVIVRKHMLPNALMPIITGVGGGLATVVAGSPVMESVFSIPGIGAYMLVGINQRDRPIVLACVVFFALFTSVAMLVMDLCYAFLDPRIKAQYARRKGK
ncbi:MAG: ABC transporter permease [Oscillospiraceae bacterium]